MRKLLDIASALDWSDWITAIATLVLAILTFIYVRLTRSILATPSDPCVVLTVVHDEERVSILQLVAKNIGTGLATEIRFEFNHPVPDRAWGVAESDAKEAVEMKHGPLIEGIPALGPGETRRIDWGQYGGLKVALAGKNLVATLRFRKGKKEMPAIRCPLDIESYAHTVVAEKPAVKAAKELAEISKHLKQLAAVHSKLRIEVISLPEAKERDGSV
ncbi:hypothetical protein [Nitrosococcus watsonii]|uniref:Uncharacterized protein n=1 Tax=Nitrosococcus watsoni (strain C-113) TaxID=105559 RepID=D8KBG8_NITWC|nr:hypothetical protein [Nitrosococcus watsonii]ADJ29615.1 hypothetical protein Nwat_2868 [Nitrosococcus watsonii C-113]